MYRHKADQHTGPDCAYVFQPEKKVMKTEKKAKIIMKFEDTEPTLDGHVLFNAEVVGFQAEMAVDNDDNINFVAHTLPLTDDMSIHTNSGGVTIL